MNGQEILTLMDRVVWLNPVLLSSLLFLCISAFSKRLRKAAKIAFSLLVICLLGYLVFVTLAGSFLWLLADGELSASVPVLMLFFAFSAGLAWFWFGPKPYRESVPLAVTLLVIAATWIMAPAIICRSGIDLRLSKAAHCMALELNARDTSKPHIGFKFSAQNYLEKAANWGDNEIAFDLYQATGNSAWLIKALDGNDKDARYQYYRKNKESGDATDVELLNDLAKLGQVDAQYDYAKWLLDNSRIQEGFEQLLEAGESGSIRAQQELALEYLGGGLTGRSDHDIAQNWLDTYYAELRVIDEHPDIGTSFYTGYIPDGYTRATLLNRDRKYNYFQNQFDTRMKREERVAKGDPTAYLERGENLLRQENVDANQLAIGALKVSANRGNLKASQLLYKHFERAMKKQPELRDEWLVYVEKAAYLDDPRAALSAAEVYAQGKYGRSVNLSKAMGLAEITYNHSRQGGWDSRKASDIYNKAKRALEKSSLKD